MEFDRLYGDPRHHNQVSISVTSIKLFTHRLRSVCWPPNFKLSSVESYKGDMDPEAWLMLYEIAVRAVGGDDHVMANYVPVVLDAAAN